MDLRNLVTVTIGLLVIGWLAHGIKRFRAKTSPQSIQKVVVVSDPAMCAKVMACKGYNNTGAKNRYTEVLSRAIPNQRLIRAFVIDNSFTTSDDERRKEFNKEAGKAMKMTDGQWQDVAEFAKELVCQAVPSSKPTAAGQMASVTLDSLVRSVCLKVVLRVLFRENELELDDEVISTVTESINILWIQSKGTGTPTESDKTTLQEALTKVFPKVKWSNPHENPLNLIMPAYETLWRVILSGFLQVTFVKGASPAFKMALAQFLANPTAKARKDIVHGPEATTVSVDDIVSETLRLYPSVKRVYRRFHMDNKTGPEDVAADIEASQRDKALWGADAQHFNPSRWINASDEARKSFVAFGFSRFVCPAKVEFGPMMIGILVAVFADRVKSEDWDVRCSDAAQGDLDKALNGEGSLVSDRSTYEGIRIVGK